ncbi:MAG: class I SAM-dependent DNA methyltransferase [Solirubrobacterales bacterium]
MTRSAPAPAGSRARFEGLYRADPDPWATATSPYEREKFARTLQAAGSGPLGDVLELGCGVGTFTELLVPRARRVIAVDFSITAVGHARRRLAEHVLVEVATAQLPEEQPAGPFEAIFACELLYYWDPPVVADAARRMVEALRPGGQLICATWRGTADDLRMDAAAAHGIVAAQAGLRRTGTDLQPGYQLDHFLRP